jgi:hypothetical protein
MVISEQLKRRVNESGDRIPMSLIRGVAEAGDSPYWFTSGATGFFKSKYPDYAYRKGNKAYFITKETNPSGDTASSIREIDLKTGNIGTVGDFHSYTGWEARTELNRILSIGKRKSGKMI